MKSTIAKQNCADDSNLMIAADSEMTFFRYSQTFTSEDCCGDPAMIPDANRRKSSSFSHHSVGTGRNLAPDWFAYFTSLLHNVFATVSCKTCSGDLGASEGNNQDSSLEMPEVVCDQPVRSSVSKTSLLKGKRKSAAKKAAANTNQTGGGGSHSPNCGAGGGGTYSPLGTSPTTNSLLSSFTSSNLSHQPQRQQETNNNSHCFTHKGESLQSDQHSTAGHHPQVANFNISSFPHSLVGALRGSANTTPGSESSPNESADELNCSGISSATMGLGFGGGAGGNHPAYLASCATLERTRRYQECKIMVQLPRGFDRLEWLAYHATFLVRFVGMFWLSNHLSQHCQCTNLSAPPNNSVWTMTDERTGKKSGHKSAIDAKTAIENSLKNLEKILDNEDLFPSKYGNQFNNDFENLVKRSCRSLFCILTHLLHAHFHSLVEKKVDASTIDLFSYLITFARQFTLIDKKDFAAAEQIEQVLNQLHN